MSRVWRLALASLVLAPVALWTTGSAQAAGLPPIRHVFVIVLENESAATTFGAGSPAPYLSGTLRAEGAYLPHYYGIGHQSNDNYVAMISGQAPNAQNQADCQFFDELAPGTVGSYGQVQGTGCVYPASTSTIADQLTAAGLTWRDYNESMGADPAREPGECAHPAIDAMDNTQTATAGDQYATRHNPFVYFHSIIDDTALCDSHVVNLGLLSRDLASAQDTPNYVFITPDLCDDGHDAPCKDGRPGGLAQADGFLRQWVPQIVGSPAFRQEHGLLIVTFDEAATSDTSACCGEIPGPGSPQPGVEGPGGGDTGAVLLSPCIAPGTVSATPYNHYSMLRSVEDLFGLAHLGYAALPGESSFGADVFTRSCGPSPPVAHVSAPALASSAAPTPRIPIRWSATSGGAAVVGFTVQVRTLGAHAGRWRTLPAQSGRDSLTFGGAPGASYQFRVEAVDQAGRRSGWATATCVVPTGVLVRGGRYRGSWHVRRVRDAWEGHAIVTSQPGASFSLRYRGGAVFVIGDRWPQSGRIEVTLDGHARELALRSARPRARALLYSGPVRPGAHRLTITVLSGVVALEGLAIAARSG